MVVTPKGTDHRGSLNGSLNGTIGEPIVAPGTPVVQPTPGSMFSSGGAGRGVWYGAGQAGAGQAEAGQWRQGGQAPGPFPPTRMEEMGEANAFDTSNT